MLGIRRVIYDDEMDDERRASEEGYRLFSLYNGHLDRMVRDSTKGGDTSSR